MLNGDFSNTSSFSGLSNSFVSTVPTNLVNGRIPASQIDPNGQALLRLLPRPNADPALTGGYNYVESVELDQNMQQWLTRVDVNVSDNTRIFARYNLQTETQNFPVGLWWRNANQVPYPTAVTAPNRSHSTTMSLTHVFGPTLTSESTFAATFIDFPNQLADPSRVSRAALGYTNPGIYDSGLDQIPSMTGWGNGPTMFNPGGFDPVLFAKKWLISGAQSVTKVQRRAHDEGRRLLRVGQQQPAGQRRLERPPGSGVVGRQHAPATTSPTCSPATSPSTASSRRTSSATWPTTSSRATSRTAGRRSTG